MYTIDNKFEIGEECYTVYGEPIHYKCPICEGNGKFMHNKHEIWCRNCNGSGKLHNHNQCIMKVCKVRIKKIIASIFNTAVTIKYKVALIDNVSVNINNRSNNLFKTMEEAEEYCAEANNKHVI